MSVWLLFNAKSGIFQLYHGEKKLMFNEIDDVVCFVLDQHALLDFYDGASSLKQQSADRHVTQFRHIILILSQPVFALSP